jgi:uncharacterized protein YggE
MTRHICRLISLAFALLLAARLDAEQSDGINVSATGEAMVKPNRLELEVKAGASAELTSDAVVKYHDALKRAKESIEKLRIENLEIVERGVNVSTGFNGQNGGPGYAMPVPFGGPGGGQPTLKAEVAIAKSLRLTVKGIDKLSDDQVIAIVAKLLDGVKDAGLIGRVDPNNSDGQQGAGTMITFIADDLSAARKQATAQAFRSAKEKAQEIAELAGGRLGAATGVQEEISPGVNQMVQEEGPNGQIYYSGGSPAADARLASPTMAEIPLRVTLQVQFKLQPGEAAK